MAASRTQRDTLASRIGEVEAERDALASVLEDAETRLSGLDDAQGAITGLLAQMGELEAARAAQADEAEALQGRIAELEASLERERQSGDASLDGLEDQLRGAETARDELAERLARMEEQAAGLEGELAAARAEDQ